MSGAAIAIGIRSSSGLDVDVSRDVINSSKYGAGSLTTQFVYALPVGGIGPYTYLWTFVGADAGISLTSTTQSGVRAQKTSGTAPASAGATIKCTVTDNTGATGDSLPISIVLQWF